MSMRIQEIHPAIVHFPMALFPTSIAADLLGTITKSESLSEAGKWGMVLSAGSAILSTATGAIAQETAKIDGEAYDYLVTHRNLNLGFLGLAAYMAARRAKASQADVGYLALGALGTVLLTYSAYLGGHMVYEYGVGVKEADTLKEENAPEIRFQNIGKVTYAATRSLWTGVSNTLEGLASGNLVPLWTNGNAREEKLEERPG